jgi:lipopolysaccharide biosynthesis glycosyltransferase
MNHKYSHILGRDIKTMVKKELNILYLTDNNYAAFAGVSITSLFINNKNIDKLHVYVIDDRIEQINKDKMLELASQYGHDIIFLDLTEGIRILQDMGIPKYRNSYTTYLKLFTFNLLPDNVKRIFFIDSDSVVVDDLSDLIDIDMQGHMIAAVRDGISHPYKIALGFDKDDSWFNMGVMLVDVEAWKANHAQDKIIAQLKKRKGYIAVDQDLLNITQHGNIMTLHPKYNATPHHYVYKETAFRRAFPQGGFYDSLEIMKEAQEHPVIRHFERFVGQSAWNLETVHPYAFLFDQYLAQSPWKDYKKKRAQLSGVLKIENILYKILPPNIFVYIYALGFKRYLLNTNRKLESAENITNIS